MHMSLSLSLYIYIYILCVYIYICIHIYIYIYVYRERDIHVIYIYIYIHTYCRLRTRRVVRGNRLCNAGFPQRWRTTQQSMVILDTTTHAQNTMRTHTTNEFNSAGGVALCGPCFTILPPRPAGGIVYDVTLNCIASYSIV